MTGFQRIEVCHTFKSGLSGSTWERPLPGRMLAQHAQCIHMNVCPVHTVHEYSPKAGIQSLTLHGLQTVCMAATNNVIIAYFVSTAVAVLRHAAPQHTHAMTCNCSMPCAVRMLCGWPNVGSESVVTTNLLEHCIDNLSRFD